MLQFIAKRALAAIPLFLLLSLVVFVLLDLMGGGAAEIVAGEDATTEEIEAARERLGLNQPLIYRYVDWLSHAVRGDLGQSLHSSASVSGLIMERIGVTLSLAALTLLIAILVGVPVGILAAQHPNGWLDRSVIATASILMAVPPFVLALILVLTFAIGARLLPATGYVPISAGVWPWLSHLILPALALAAISGAELARQARAAMVDTLGRDYVRTARAKGLQPRSVVGKHALKNAGIPIITIVGLQAGTVLAGAVTVEFVFNLPGFGSLAVSAVNQRDVPLILGIVVVSAVAVLVVNLLVDLAYGYFDPKLRS